MSAQAALRQIKIVHLAFIATIFLYLYMLFLFHPVERKVDQFFVFAIAAAAVLVILNARYMRRRWLMQSLELVRTNPEDTAALKRWQSHSLISFAHAETVMLFGFALKFFYGAGWSIAGVFFAIGFLLFLAWTPKLDLPTRP